MPGTLEETLSYIMTVLRHTQMQKPDWQAIATEQGISRADNAQQKFRRMIKDLGLEYVDNQIIDPNGNGGDNIATATPRKRKSPTKKEKAGASVGRSSKKTKVSEPKAEVKAETHDEDAEGEA